MSLERNLKAKNRRKVTLVSSGGQPAGKTTITFSQVQESMECPH